MGARLCTHCQHGRARELHATCLLKFDNNRLRVGQNHTYICTYSVYTVILAGKYHTYGHTVTYSVHIRFWPTFTHAQVTCYISVTSPSVKNTREIAVYTRIHTHARTHRSTHLAHEHKHKRLRNQIRITDTRAHTNIHHKLTSKSHLVSRAEGRTYRLEAWLKMTLQACVCTCVHVCVCVSVCACTCMCVLISCACV